jgi:uncharacterized protein (TIGR02996 family)
VTDRDALFAAILANPDEDTPRLALADWLEEHGDARYAAFIRKQIELAKVPEWDPLRVGTWDRDRDLITGRNYETFRPELPEGLGWPTLETFRRGFPWGVESVGPEPFLANAEQIFAAAPVQSLVICAGDQWRVPVDLSALLASPHLARLHRLAFSVVHIAPEMARALADCPHLANLRTLSFHLATLHPGAVRELLRGPLIERLETLEFQQTDNSWHEVAEAVTAATGPHRLRRFQYISFNHATFSNARVFDAPLLRGLRDLEVTMCAMSEAALVALGESPRGLRCLRLRYNRMGPVAVKALARSPHLSGLQVLDLRGNPLGDRGAIELAAAPWLKNVAVLGLGNCEVGDRGAEALAEVLVPGTLVHLDLSSLPGAELNDPMKQKVREKFGLRSV